MTIRKIHCSFLWVTLSTVTLLTIGYFTPRKWVYPTKEGCGYEVCVNDTGIHSNLIIPVNNQIFDWNNYLSLENIGSEHDKYYNYLSFGWGDRDFYIYTPTIQDLDLSITFKALFIPTHSVMYVQGYQAIPQMTVKCVKVRKDDYLQLMQFINYTFQADAKGRKIRIANGHRPNAGFYAANGSYSIIRDCNSWTAEGLRTADVNTPLWDGLSSAIMLHMKSGCD